MITRIFKFYLTDKIIFVCFLVIEEIFTEVFQSVKFLRIVQNKFYFSETFTRMGDRKKILNLKPKKNYDSTVSVTSTFLIFNSSAEKIILMYLSHYL